MSSASLKVTNTPPKCFIDLDAMLNKVNKTGQTFYDTERPIISNGPLLKTSLMLCDKASNRCISRRRKV